MEKHCYFCFENVPFEMQALVKKTTFAKCVKKFCFWPSTPKSYYILINCAMQFNRRFVKKEGDHFSTDIPTISILLINLPTICNQARFFRHIN